MQNILLMTLGASWAVVPEIYAFLAPEHLPLYAEHPENETFLHLREEYALQVPDEIWLCTTQGQITHKSLNALTEWSRLLGNPINLRIWQAEGTDELASQAECERMRELIVRACLKAHAEAKGGQVILSLAGGRKTMSADLQWAAGLFGCQALLHVVGKDYQAMPKALQEAAPETFTRPFDAGCCHAVTPLLTGKTQPSDLIDIRMDRSEAIATETFPLPLPETGKPCLWRAGPASLAEELKRREQQGSRLLGNYLSELSRNEHHENWRSLYRLPPRTIDRLRATPLEQRHEDWLNQLPKADLHRHIGGCLDLNAQRRVAETVWHSLSQPERQQALNLCRPLLQNPDWPWQWPARLQEAGIRSHNCAALLLHADEERLRYNLWGKTQPRVALTTRHPQGFAAYERPGELTGSAILSHAAAIEPYAREIVTQAAQEGLAYVELRGSPQKYGDGLIFLERFNAALRQALTSLPSRRHAQFRFIVIADRRDGEGDRKSRLRHTIQLAVTAHQRWPEFVVGLDMAGDEQQTPPSEIAELFTPAFEQCLPITIHAGEGQPAESIWQAAYHLHADRIGHGLTLNENPSLAQRFRNRDICLELCPTSNREVVGYRDPQWPESEDCKSYPLMDLWREGMPLTLCTDNPGISLTTLSEEYLTAARMSQGQLTQWDALAMIKQSFIHAFLPGKQKETILKQCDSEMYEILSRQG
ncbi:MAG: adenosine deaminase [Gammaproteobacteria bacterium HGW-Gammaproteobacteria-10]|nr:MAG: adenosine deaminase [Gammaproteobacteria bacterium HGW-Gammaproteobacteria-10]